MKAVGVACMCGAFDVMVAVVGRCNVWSVSLRLYELCAIELTVRLWRSEIRSWSEW